MRRYSTCILMSLLMITTTLAGCTGNANGDGDADPTSDASTVIINNYYNNTTNTASADNPSIHYAVGGVSIEAGQMVEVLAVWYNSSPIMYQSHTDLFASCLGTYLNNVGGMQPHWLPTDGGACNYSVWEQLPNVPSDFSIVYRIHNITYDGLHLTNSSPFPPTNYAYQYSATDHTDVPDAGTDDSLFVLQFNMAFEDLAWADIHITIIGDDGVPTTCAVDAGEGNCKLIQYGSDILTWEMAEIVHVTENGKAICAIAPCVLTIKISDTRNSVDLNGSGSVVVE